MGVRKRKLVNKTAKKRADGCCFFCKESDYCLLDVHRILEGADGGTYADENTVTACANCHRKIHSGKIKLDRKYFSSTGKWVLHYWDEDGSEKWI